MAINSTPGDAETTDDVLDALPLSEVALDPLPLRMPTD